MKHRLIYIISEINNSLYFEWIAGSLKDHYDLKFILIGCGNSGFHRFLQLNQIPVFFIPLVKKTDFFPAWIKVVRILYKEQPFIIHTHLWKANLIGLSAAWISGVKRRIFTRHHAMIHYNEFPSGRKWDLLCNYLATDIIAISDNIKNILINRDKANAGKIILINHGFKIDYFHLEGEERIIRIREKYDIPVEGYPVIGVISRYVRLKGIQFIIPAFKMILETYPAAHLVLANTIGDYSDEIRNLLAGIPAGKYTEIVFEEDLAALYRLFNVFIHVPVDKQSEAFGQVYIEPLLCGIPSVFTLSGIATEFIRDRENAMIVDYENSDQIFQAVINIVQDDALKNKIIESGKKSVRKFSLEKHIDLLERLYLKKS